MKEQLISFDTAKLAKEKGFDISTIDLWYFKPKYSKKPDLHKGQTTHMRFKCASKSFMGSNTSDYEISRITIEDLLQSPSKYPAEKYLYLAPTQSLLQKWLREKHNIHINPRCQSGKYLYTYVKETKKSFIWGGSYNTYEEALEAGLLEALKLIK